ncbi:MAG: DUF1285 domain-containing protein [Pseudomonadota bacterium]
MSNSIDKLATEIGRNRTAPVHLWKPDHEGSIEIRIDSKGDWYYRESFIQRPELVALFASVLLCEDDRYFLITPVEKLQIEVEDVPFIIVDMDIHNEHDIQHLALTTNVGDRIIVGPQNPIEVRYQKTSDTDIPYVLVRANLYARVNRAVYYRMVDACVEIEGFHGISSGGQFFPLVQAS